MRLQAELTWAREPFISFVAMNSTNPGCVDGAASSDVARWRTRVYSRREPGDCRATCGIYVPPR